MWAPFMGFKELRITSAGVWVCLPSVDNAQTQTHTPHESTKDEYCTRQFHQLNSEWTARLVQSESTKSDVLSTHFPSHSSPSVTKREEEEKRNTSSDNTIKPVQTAAATNRPYTPRGQMRDGLHRNTTHHPHPKSLRPPWSKPQTRLSNINEKTDTVLLPKPISNTSETLRKVTKSTGGT